MSPLKSFICPDNTKITTEQCLAKCPRPQGRCLSLPTLMEVSYDRVYNGTPSTTQLLNPTRYEYLKIKYDYMINPFNRAFALLGTRHHRRLELIAKRLENLQAEKKLTGEISGVVDLLEPNGENTFRLIDYKTFGNYQMVKLQDENSPEYQKLALQCCNYRLMAQELGFAITEIFAQVTIRDGGTWVARKNGICERMIFMPVKILDDDFVKDYFISKEFKLKDALIKNELPELCDYQNRWGNRRCSPEFCEVVSHCPEGASMNKMPLET